ncbi:MAG: sialidase family protein, partial [Nitrospiria bacterium]
MRNKKSSNKSIIILSIVWIGLLMPVFFSGIATVDSSTFRNLSSKGFKSLDLYAEGNVLHMLYAAPADDEKPVELYYARSDDGGKRWGFAVQIDTGADPPHHPHHGSSPQIAVSGDRVVVIWTAEGSGFRGRGPMASAISTDRGLHWKAGPAPSAIANRGGQAFHDIIADEKGIFHNVWLDKRTGNKEKGLYYTRSENGGRTWTETAVIDVETCACCWNSLAQGRHGSLYVLYRDAKPRDMALAKVTQDGLKTVGGTEWNRLGHVGAFDWRFDGCPHVGGGLQVVDT